MSRKELPRAGLVQAALAGKITNQKAPSSCTLTMWQFQRLEAAGPRRWQASYAIFTRASTIRS